MPEFEWTDEMDEISGFGEEGMWDYEQACRDMVIAGAEWIGENESDPEFTEIDGVTGIINAENDAAEGLTDAMADAVEGDSPTGAMMHTCVAHVLWIAEHGWDEYVERMEDRAGR